MATKKPLALYSGRSAQLMQGDVIATSGAEGTGLAPGSTGLGLVIIAGQSNARGMGDTDKADTGYAIATPFAAVLQNEQQGSGSDPVIWEWPTITESLQPYAPPGSAGFGPELTLGRSLVANGFGNKIFIGKFSDDSTGLGDDWLPSSPYPTQPPAGPNLYTQLVAFVQARIVESKQQLGALVWVQGEHDAQSMVLANAYAANLTTFVDALRAVFGPFAFIFNELNIALSPAPFLTTVRAQQLLYAASDPNSVLVYDDDLPLGADATHYPADSLISLGNRFANASMSLVAPIVPVQRSFPTYIGADPGVFVAAGGAGPMSPRWGGEVPYVVGDVGIMAVVTGGGATVPVTLTSAQGFTLIGDQELSFGGTFSRITLYWARATSAPSAGWFGGMSPPIVTPDPATTQAASRIFIFRGCVSSGSPVDVFAGDGQFGMAPSIAGDTTNGQNRLIAAFFGGLTGTQGTTFSSPVNAALKFLTEQQDSSYAPTGNYELITLVTGLLPVQGAYPATTGVRSANTWNAGLAIALIPEFFG